MISFDVNGSVVESAADPDTPLLWVLRDELALTGTKYGCGIGQCGACTVHLDGAAVRSCSVNLGAVAGRQITTIEGLATGKQLHAVQRAWLAEQVPQCGYCQPGMIMATAALIRQNPAPTEADIQRGITNICRCGTYPRIQRAALLAASIQATETAGAAATDSEEVD